MKGHERDKVSADINDISGILKIDRGALNSTVLFSQSSSASAGNTVSTTRKRSSVDQGAEVPSSHPKSPSKSLHYQKSKGGSAGKDGQDTLLIETVQGNDALSVQDTPTRGQDEPLPIFQILIISVILFSNNFNTTVILPFVPFMVDDFHVAEVEEDVGKYSGYLLASFMAGQLLCSYGWGLLSDRLGRRPVLIFGLFASSLTSLAFGFATTYTWAIIWRFLSGGVNGVAGVSKAWLGEISSSKNQGKGFALMGLSRSLGLMVGPALGGLLCLPAVKYPSVFPRGSLFDRFPYALPTCIGFAIGFSGSIAAYFVLQETIRKSPVSVTNGAVIASPSSDSVFDDSDSHSDNEGDPLLQNTRESSPLMAATKKSSTNLADVLRLKNTWLSIFAYAAVSYLFIQFDELFVLWARSPPAEGGINFDTSEIGLAYSAGAPFLFIFSAFFYSVIERRIGSLNTYRSGIVVALPSFLMLPVVNTYLAPISEARSQKMATWILVIVVIILRTIAGVQALTSTMILVSNSSTPSTRGQINGIAHSVGALARMIGPVIIGYVFSWSLENQLGSPLDYHAPFIYIFVTGLLILLSTGWMSASVNERLSEALDRQEPALEEIAPSDNARMSRLNDCLGTRVHCCVCDNKDRVFSKIKTLAVIIFHIKLAYGDETEYLDANAYIVVKPDTLTEFTQKLPNLSTISSWKTNKPFWSDEFILENVFGSEYVDFLLYNKAVSSKREDVVPFGIVSLPISSLKVPPPGDIGEWFYINPYKAPEKGGSVHLSITFMQPKSKHNNMEIHTFSISNLIVKGVKSPRNGVPRISRHESSSSPAKAGGNLSPASPLISRASPPALPPKDSDILQRSVTNPESRAFKKGAASPLLSSSPETVRRSFTSFQSSEAVNQLSDQFQKLKSPLSSSPLTIENENDPPQSPIQQTHQSAKVGNFFVHVHILPHNASTCPRTKSQPAQEEMAFNEMFVYSLDVIEASETGHGVVFSVWEQVSAQDCQYHGYIYVSLLAMIQHRMIDAWFDLIKVDSVKTCASADIPSLISQMLYSKPAMGRRSNYVVHNRPHQFKEKFIIFPQRCECCNETVFMNLTKCANCSVRGHKACLAKLNNCEPEIGKLKLSWKMEEIKILPLDCYKELLEIMQERNFALPTLLGQTTQREPIAHVLVQLYRAEGSTQTFLKTVLHKEIESTTTPAILFRGNSLASKALDVYMKLVAYPHLKAVLEPTLKHIHTTNLNCEMDPSKREAGKDKTLSSNTENLKQYVDSFLAAIFNPSVKLPAELEVLFAFMRARVESRFPGHVQARYTALTGFLFLRFYVPAILNPRLFKLEPREWSARGSRTLTLCAKVIQNLANISRFGDKEAFMSSLNSYILEKEASMISFIDQAASSGATMVEKEAAGNKSLVTRACCAELSTLIQQTLSKNDLKKDLKDKASLKLLEDIKYIVNGIEKLVKEPVGVRPPGANSMTLLSGLSKSRSGSQMNLLANTRGPSSSPLGRSSTSIANLLANDADSESKEETSRELGKSMHSVSGSVGRHLASSARGGGKHTRTASESEMLVMPVRALSSPKLLMISPPPPRQSSGKRRVDSQISHPSIRDLKSTDIPLNVETNQDRRGGAATGAAPFIGV